MKRKILFVGFERYGSKMYPHSYHVLALLKKRYELSYYGKEDRGHLGLCIAKEQISWSNFRTWKAFLLNLYWLFRSSTRIDKELKGLLQKTAYDLVIVIDQSAYWRIVRLSRRQKKKSFKIILWSHDYYCPGHPLFSLFWIQRIIRHNRKNIHQCASIIIQDPPRSLALDSQIYAEKVPRIYLPVSLFPERQTKAIALKNARKSFPKKKRVTLLQLGCIGKERCCDLFLEEYQNFPDHIRLLYHGFIQDDMRSLLKSSLRKPIIRKARSDIKAMWESLSRADIALLSFRDHNLNTFFTSKASGQLAEFMRCGIPVICFHLPEMGFFLEAKRAGFYLRELSDLQRAVHQILLRYKSYSRFAYLTYLKYFDLSKHENTLIESLERLSNSKTLSS